MKLGGHAAVCVEYLCASNAIVMVLNIPLINSSDTFTLVDRPLLQKVLLWLLHAAYVEGLRAWNL